MPRFTLPSLKDLKNSFEDLEKNYKAEKSKPNETRLKQLDLVRAIIASLKGVDFTNSEYRNRIQADSQKESHNVKKEIITGSLLFLTKQITNEYNKSYANYLPFYNRIVKPKNSDVYKGVFHALGINENNYLTKEDERNYLNKFRYYLEDLMDNPSNCLDVNYFTLISVRDIRQLTITCTTDENTEIQVVDKNNLIQAKSSLNPGQNQVDKEINDHLESSTLHMWQKMMETSCVLTKPENYSKEQIEQIQDNLKNAEKMQQYEPKFLEYNLHGYRRAFENDGDKEALKRIDEHEKIHSQLAIEIKNAPKKDISIDNIERLNMRGPMLMSKQMYNRELFFNSLKNEIETFDKGNLKPIESNLGL